MIRRPPGSTRTDTLFPYTTLFRSPGKRVLSTGRDEICGRQSTHGVPPRPQISYWCRYLDRDLLADDAAGAARLHRDAVEDVGRFHRALLVAHDYELRLLAELVHEVEEAVQVDVVEGRLDLVHHVEGCRPAAEEGEGEGQGREEERGGKEGG